MLNFENILKLDPYSLKYFEKKEIFNSAIIKLTRFHIKNCAKYNKILNGINFKAKSIKNYIDTPFLPVKIFKEFDLKSINEKDIFKILRSSGTSGNIPSKIYLDKFNASNQAKVLNKIVVNLLGSSRSPMLIIDSHPNISDRKMLGANLAAIYGFSIFGKNHTFLLNKYGNINYDILNNFLKNFGNQKFFMFGFTSKIFQKLILELDNDKIFSNFNNGILLHGGGWKKLNKIKISNKLFKQKLFNKINLKKIFNYYGLVEQTGSIFLESEKCGYFHTTNFSEIIIRDKNFKILKKKEKGLIQLISLLPTSYPGHSILTEDIGEIIGQDDCICGLSGKYFLVHGRTKKAEVRGCSDT